MADKKVKIHMPPDGKAIEVTEASAANAKALGYVEVGSDEDKAAKDAAKAAEKAVVPEMAGKK